MKIQVLFFQGCPNFQAAVDLVRSVAPQATIEEVEIKTQQDAVRMRFLGSPTILVDGVDVEVSARDRTDYGFACRIYGGRGLPSRELLAAAIDGSAPLAERASSRWFAGSSVVVAAIASVCCWLPLVLLAFGVSTVGLTSSFEVFRPWLLAAAAILLVAGFYSAYFSQPCCTRKSRRLNQAMVWGATAWVLAMAFIPSYAQEPTEPVEGPACCTLPNAGKSIIRQVALSEETESLTVLSDDAHELKEAFNAVPAAAKVMLIVSPRCPACRDGATEVQQKALAKIDSDKLKIYVVWINRYPGDSRKSAEAAMELVPDRRARHFWDGSGALGRSFGKIVQLPGGKKFAWDVYFVFARTAQWTENPPAPAFWMHQLGGPETGNLLDGGKFREAIFKQLP